MTLTEALDLRPHLGDEGERDALRAELNALRVEAQKSFSADQDIADAWDAIGTRGNSRTPTA